MDKNPVKNKYVVLIKSRRILLQSEILRVRNSVIEISRTRETRSQLRMERHKNTFVSLSSNSSYFMGIWSGYCRKVTRSRILHFRLDGGHKKLRGMNLEQNLPFSWLPLKKGHKKATYRWCLQDQQCDLLKVNRTNLKLVDIPERTPVNIADPVHRWI